MVGLQPFCLLVEFLVGKKTSKTSKFPKMSLRPSFSGSNWNSVDEFMCYHVGVPPPRLAVTTRVYTCRIGDTYYKPPFATITGKGELPKLSFSYLHSFQSGFPLWKCQLSTAATPTRRQKTQQNHGNHHRTGIYIAEVEFFTGGCFHPGTTTPPVESRLLLASSGHRKRRETQVLHLMVGPALLSAMTGAAYAYRCLFFSGKKGQPSWGCIFCRKDNLKICSIWSELADWVWIGGGNSRFANPTLPLRGLKWWSAESFLLWRFRET